MMFLYMFPIYMCFKTKVMLRYMFPISNVCFQTTMFSKYISNIEPNLMYGFEYFKSKKNTEKKELLIILIFCSLFAQRELFALFVVRTVRMVRTVRTVRRSHCSNSSPGSLFALFVILEKNCCSLFALFGANSANERTANTFVRSSVVPALNKPNRFKN